MCPAGRQGRPCEADTEAGPPPGTRRAAGLGRAAALDGERRCDAAAGDASAATASSRITIRRSVGPRMSQQALWSAGTSIRR